MATPPFVSLDEHSAHYRGAVCASWMGSIHRVVDSGLPPTAPAHAAAFPWPAQRELAVVLYAPNVLRMSKTRLLRLRPAGSLEASSSARPCSRLPRVSASLGWPAIPALLSTKP